MKRVLRNLLFITCMLSLTACLPPPPPKAERKAHKLIKKYIEKNLHFPRSYKPVEFEKMDTVMSTFWHSPEFHNLPAEGRIQAQSDSITDYWEYKRRIKDGFYAQMDKLRDRAADSLQRAHKPTVGYYNVVHTYRADDGVDKRKLHLTIFRIDTNFTKVLEAINRSTAFKIPDEEIKKMRRQLDKSDTYYTGFGVKPADAGPSPAPVPVSQAIQRPVRLL